MSTTALRSPFDRVIWIVLDGVGAGELPDAAAYGDQGSDTLGNLSRAFAQKMGRSLALPNLERWGLGSLTPMQGINPMGALSSGAAIGRAREKSTGKDTTSGHWEMCGLVVKTPFKTYPNGFDPAIVQRWCDENNLPGVLGNCVASGTEIIEKYGAEHLRTGKPILYTSADSVWQVAAHEESFGLEKLNKICKSAREICNELDISRVISRPFVGNPEKGIPFSRTYNRKDLAQPPSVDTVLDHLVHAHVPTLGIGKISSIFAGHGIEQNIDTKGNVDSVRVLTEQIQTRKNGLIYANLIDFDMLYGHRRDVEGFGRALEVFDQGMPAWTHSLNDRDLVLITADHGNDPTYKGTDHTREYIPMLAYSKLLERTRGGKPPVKLGDRDCFGDLGMTVVKALKPELLAPGSTLLRELDGKDFLSEMGL